MLMLNFMGKTNDECVYVNYAVFRLKSGSTITVDRWETNYNVDYDGNLDMDWKCCYITQIDGITIVDNDQNLLIDGAVELFEGATLEELVIEDDAPENYIITDIEWSVA